MTDKHIIITREDKIIRITINRPDKKNAITDQMYNDLVIGLEQAANDDTIVAVILNGAGDGFTAGNDLKSFLSAPEITADTAAPKFLRVLAAFPKILIAAVHGAAVGIGTTLLLHCDLVVAAKDAKFQLPFINLGLVPEAAASLLLPLRLGHARASELLLLGDAFDADAAFEMGLVNRVVERGDVDAVVNELAARISAKPVFALLETKKLLKAASTDIASRMEEEFESFGACLNSDAFKVAAQAFFAPKKG